MTTRPAYTRIQTFSGGSIDLLNPDPADVRSADIAHALSLINRYTGHSRVGYPVASHVIHVMRLLPLDLQRAGLMHDFPEAYLGDWSTILKIAVDEMTDARGYDNPLRVLSSRMQAAIWEAYGLPAPTEADTAEIAAVKHADLAALTIEHREMMPQLPPDDRLYWPFVDVSGVSAYASHTPDFCTPAGAERMLLREMKRLGLRAVGDP